MFVAFDLETTGFSDVTSDVIQFAYIMFDNNNTFVKAESLYFYYEGMSWSEDAYNVHHLSQDFLRQHKDKFRENLIKTYSVLNRANVIGHNSEGFDCPFIRNWLRRMGISGLEFGIRNDTMKAFRPLTKRARISLTNLCKLMEITPEYITTMTKIWFEEDYDFSHHNAAYDTAATALLTLKGLERNLIAFAPLNKTPTATTSVDGNNSSINMNSMLENYETIPADPNRFLIELSENANSTDTQFVYVNHDKNAYAESVPVGTDVINATHAGTLFPKILVKDTDCANTYTCEHAGVKYIFTQGDKGDTFIIKTPYMEISDVDVDMRMVIKNNFKDKDGDK